MKTRGGDGFWVRLASGMVISTVFPLLLAVLIAHYWRYGDYGGAGSNGMALMLLVLPLSLVVFAGVALGASAASRRLALPLPREVLVMLAAATLTLAALFLLEVWRISLYDAGSGKNLLGFLKSLT